MITNARNIGSNKAGKTAPRPHSLVTALFRLFCVITVMLLSTVTIEYFGASQSASASTLTWSPPTKIIPKAGGGWISSVSCPTTTFCVAVDNGGYALTYNGSSWTAPVSVDGTNWISSVSCPTTTFCVAGDYKGNALTYNGSSWSAPVSVGMSNITSVSCPTTTFCVAGDLNGYAHTYNGSSWSTPINIGMSSISSVSCPTTSFCVAANGGYALTYNGSSWTAPVSVDGTNWISSVSCPTTTFCVAGDYKGNALTYNGSSWSAPVSVGMSNITSVSCPTTTFCVAGDLNGYAHTYNGSSWSTPINIGMSSISSVSCPTTSFCVAANGGYALTYNGSSWTAPVSVDPNPFISSVSCPTTSFCVAANGGYALTYNGSSWTAPVSVDGTSGGISSVSCPTTTFCMAVGIGYALTYNGSGWSTPVRVDGTNWISSVSCPTTTFCVAGDYKGNALTYNGSSWSAPVSVDTGNIINDITSLSCPTTTFCMALDVGNPQTYNGSSWSTPVNLAGFGVSISSVSCPTTSFCVAVDYDGHVYNYSNGVWSAPVSVDPTIEEFSASVSCPTTTFCVVVDEKGNAFTYNGSSWTVPVNIDETNHITSVSCPTTSFCVAVDNNASALIYGVPAVKGLSPSSGPISGGTTVTISGSGFSGATAVDFGTSPATNVVVNSDTSITAISPPGTRKVDVTVATPNGVSAVVASDEFAYISPEPYHPLTPTRICDTRPVQVGVSSNECNSGGAQTLGSGTILNIPVVGQDSIPSNATAVVANVTVTDTTSAGYLTIFPGGESTPPTASNLNWGAGASVANLVTVAIGPSGNIQAYNFQGSADVIVDIAGYYGPDVTGNAGLYVPITPKRICDTRVVQVGVVSNQCNTGSNGPIGAGQTLTVNIYSEGGLPSSGISAVALNLTAIGPTNPGYLSVYPTGGTLPTVSNVNFVAGQVVPNRVIVEVPLSGTISIYNPFGTTNIAVDVNGYFTDGSSTPSGAVSFMPITPTRICDTRPVQAGVVSNQCNLSSAGALSSGSIRVVQVSGTDNLPSNISAVVANVTITSTTSTSYLSLYPGGTLPTISDLNWVQGDTLANLAQITLSSGSFSAYNLTGSVDVMVDVEGYYS